MGLLVVNPGLSTTVQDAGRPGFAAWGVSVAGAFDRSAAALANALLGNSMGCAVLEMTLVGGSYEAKDSLALALAGAPMEARIVLPDGTEHPLRLPSSFSLRDGERLILGHTQLGARTYLAVKGGWQTSPILGSRSSEQPIRAGQHLPAATASILSRHLSEPGLPATVDAPFRVVAGPDGRLNPALDDAFWRSHRFQVGPRHDRAGLRLESEPVVVVSDPERLSTPVAPGAIQVASGQLIVLGVACGTMGGYPHVAHLISADLDRLGQLKAGDRLLFQRVTIEEARSLHLEWRTRLRSLIKRVEILAMDE